MASSPADLPRIRAEVGRALDAFVAGRQRDLAQISGQLLPAMAAITELLAGGKRLRPAFCYWGWRAVGGTDGPEIFTAAAALELLHASALVHDDVIDASDTRRGRPAAHRRFADWHRDHGWSGSAGRFGTGAAILIGDLLLAWTDEMLRASGLPPHVLARGQPVLDAMRTEVFAGQFLDLLGQVSGPAPVSSALQVVTFKSAKYTVERPLQLGGALAAAAAQPAGSRDGANQAFTAFGIPLGIAFQLRDDVLGVFGDTAETGKPVSGDLREGKHTALIAMARNRAGPAEAALLDRCLGRPDLTEPDAGAIRSVITGTGALAECEQMIDRNVRAALAALDEAPFTAEAAGALAELAVAATTRSR